MDLVDRTKQMFMQANDDMEKLLKIAGGMSQLSPDNAELQQKAIDQMEKVLVDAEAIGGGLIKEVKAIRSELSAYLKYPSEKMRVKVMQDTMRIKNKMREL
jgi:hypothetical protein